MKNHEKALLDHKEAIKLLKEYSEGFYWIEHNPDEGARCFYCSADVPWDPFKTQHDKDCLYIKTIKLLERS